MLWRASTRNCTSDDEEETAADADGTVAEREPTADADGTVAGADGTVAGADGTGTEGRSISPWPVRSQSPFRSG